MVVICVVVFKKEKIKNCKWMYKIIMDEDGQYCDMGDLGDLKSSEY